MNADHAEALVLIARTIKGIEAEEAKMTAVDRLGFHVRLKTPERVRSVRIGFPAEVRSSQECRNALVSMAKEAREKAGRPTALATIRRRSEFVAFGFLDGCAEVELVDPPLELKLIHRVAADP
jgi:hypothetical protein